MERTTPPLDTTAEAEARARQDTLTKPRGSLGRLEEIAISLAAIQGKSRPLSRPAAAIVFASDHPVCAHGVSAYPVEVTAAMVVNFLNGGAAASVLSRTLDVPLFVVDIGVDTPYVVPAAPAAPVAPVVPVAPVAQAAQGAGSGDRFVRDRVEAAGDLSRGEAMDMGSCTRAMEVGARAVDRAGTLAVLALGEMGIGNTTAAAALAGSLLSLAAKDIVGPGTGVAGDVLARKVEIVAKAIESARGATVLETLARVSGRDIAALVGAILRAAERRTAVLVDGFIVSAAALAAVRLVPSVRPYLLFSHRSAEPGHSRLLSALSAEPLLDLGMRLGEASGALTALPLLDLACALHRDMATFGEAAVPDRA